MVVKFLCCVIIEKISFSLLSGYCKKLTYFLCMPLANAQTSIAYTDTVLFLTIGKLDIYHHKSVATVSRQRQQIFIRVMNK
jgi:hypothetical protein